VYNDMGQPNCKERNPQTCDGVKYDENRLIFEILLIHCVLCGPQAAAVVLATSGRGIRGFDKEGGSSIHDRLISP